jgi:hypothetical protein
MAATPPLWLILLRMLGAMRRVPCSLDLIGQGCPRLRHAKQRSLAPGIILKLVSDLEAVDGTPPVEHYEFAWRHPLIPSASFHGSRSAAVRSQLQKTFFERCPKNTPQLAADGNQRGKSVGLVVEISPRAHSLEPHRLRRQDGLDRLKMWLSDNSVSRNPNELTNKVEVRIVVTVP